ncbi:hypothetical protein HPB50_025216 [Hyalomma asiaticum]|uniref:Uncharacterized protein n=1 Tax=Hyalomma asiaticum TaxID=266040 RepID=A0ACB7S5S3_HYAAI|nr:hypothetical protein HPB50_025216 [Hyalomma asiaticum]
MATLSGKTVQVPRNEYANSRHLQLFDRYFNGHRPVILTADLDLLKKVQIKDFHDFPDRSLLVLPRRPGGPIEKSLVQLTSNRWKEVRSVLTPSFTSNKLKLGTAGHSSSPCLTEDCQLGFQAAFPGSAQLIEDINFRLLRCRNNGVHPFEEVQGKCKRIVQQRQVDSSLRRKDLLQLMIDAKDSRVDLGSVTNNQLTAGEDNEQELPNGSASSTANGKMPVMSKTVLDDEDITQNAFLVLVAGFETTSNTMALVTHMLVHYPEVQEKMRGEILSVLKPDEPITYNTIQNLPYMNCVILETMRLYPPAFA